MYKNVPVLRKCKQKYLGVKGQYSYNIQSDGSEKSLYIPKNNDKANIKYWKLRDTGEWYMGILCTSFQLI